MENGVDGYDISQPLLTLWHLACNRTELSKCRPHLFQHLHRWHRPALSVLAMLLHASNNTFHMNAVVALSLARDLKTRIHNNEKLAHNTQMVPNTEWRVLDCVQSVFLLHSLSFLVDLVATLQSHTTRSCFSSISLLPSPLSQAVAAATATAARVTAARPLHMAAPARSDKLFVHRDYEGNASSDKFEFSAENMERIESLFGKTILFSKNMIPFIFWFVPRVAAALWPQHAELTGSVLN